MTPPTLYRIIDENPYLSREDEYPGLTLDEAASRMDDLTGVGADVILADFDEPCGRCQGRGRGIFSEDVGSAIERFEGACPTCHGTGKRSEPWEWTDEDTGREVTMRLEVG